ncbi:MAG TPA: serine/threonine-protein kinase, partial [Solirubrobacterales bacterium]|nr:serine/threonine-protein kinase [Solirubrobacterales bacterium]
WLARDERLGRAVAVKLLSDSLAHDDSYLSRFRREARLAAGLSHPNLVKVYDFGEDERPYLVMEYVEGGTLADRIAGDTAHELDPDRLARELLGALDHIHSAAIVHRDIKPGNVLIAPDVSARVTDFGIAQPEGATRLTSTGLVVGTRNYIAPEVLRGDPATVRSDLYSCAMVLQEAFGEMLPPRLAPVVEQLADEDPARRPESASAALACLAAAGAPSGPSASATAPTVPLSPDRTAPTIPIGAATARIQRRGPILAGLVALAALLLVGILMLSGGDGGSSPGDQQGEGPGTASTAKTTGTQDVPTETATPGSLAPSAKPEKGKPPKPPKSPPGKAKGRSKH